MFIVKEKAIFCLYLRSIAFVSNYYFVHASQTARYFPLINILFIYLHIYFIFFFFNLKLV